MYPLSVKLKKFLVFPTYFLTFCDRRGHDIQFYFLICFGQFRYLFILDNIQEHGMLSWTISRNMVYYPGQYSGTWYIILDNIQEHGILFWTISRNMVYYPGQYPGTWYILENIQEHGILSWKYPGTWYIILDNIQEHGILSWTISRNMV